MASVIKAGNATNGIQITSDATGILEIRTGTGAGTTAITVGTNQAVTMAGAVSSSSLTVNSNNISAVNSLGFRNRIINGDMRIDQRNNGASVTPTNGAYTLDRWAAFVSQASKITVQQNAGSVTPPAGFTNYLGVTVGASANVTVGSSDYFFIQQAIEGYNVADFGFGAAGAATITFSFWVRSSVTGTFGGVLYNGGGSRSYPYSYVINSANTWEQKTVTVVGDTTGTWQKTTSAGFQLTFSLGTGSTYNGAAGSWVGANYYGTTGAATPITTNGATFYITGVQLEAGSVATPFERRDYGRELILCQRYYEIGGATSYNNQASSVLGVPYKVTKRATPTWTALGNFYAGAEATGRAFGGGGTSATQAFYIESTSSYAGAVWAATAEL
jgi:hypothetical protein